MKVRALCLLVSVAALGCSGEGGQDLNRNLGSRDSGTVSDGQVDGQAQNTDDAEAGETQDASDLLDAQPAVDDASASLDAGQDEPDAALSAFRIHVEIRNPREHQNGIQFQLNGQLVELDDEGYLNADQPADSLQLLRGESDETVVTGYFGIQNGDSLVLLYRNFREPTTTRSVLLPVGQPPAGADSYQLNTGYISEFVTFGTSALSQYYQYGLNSFLLTARSSAVNTPLAFAFARHVVPDISGVQLPALGAWLTPRIVTLVASNTPSDTYTSLRMHSDEAIYEAATTDTVNQFAVPPGFADTLEARLVDNNNNYGPLKAVIRCGVEADQFALDFATALPLPSATISSQGATSTVTFVVPPPESRGDVLVFNGNVMPPDQTSLTVPSDSLGGDNQLMRIDFASVNSWQELKRKPIDLGFNQAGRWCYGSDQVRISSDQVIQ